MSKRKLNLEDIVELVVNGELLGVFSSEKAAKKHMKTNFSSEKAAKKHMKTNLPDYSYSILPIGTFLITDIQ